MATEHGNHDQLPNESHHEASDVSTRAILYFAIGLIVLILLTLISMKSLFNLLDEEADRSDPQLSGVATERPKLPPLPRLETDPVSARKQFFQNQMMLIESYGWVDQKQGIVRIPIERAMELLVQRGLPVKMESRGNTKNERPPGQEKLDRVERTGEGK